MQDLRPLRDQIYVLADAVPEETKRDSGIVLIKDAGKTKQAPARARIVKCGPGKEDKNGNIVPMDVKEGDLVLIHFGAGIRTGDGLNDRSDFRIIRYEDILAVINGQ